MKIQKHGKIFQERGKVFTEPHDEMDAIAENFKKNGVKKVLDLGSGSGRHIIYLAQNGFSVYGLDNSSSGLDMTKKWLKEDGLAAELIEQEMDIPFPWEDDFFDAVISIQVIRHADVSTIKKIIFEIERVIKKDGFIFITAPKLKNQGENFKQIEPNTYIPMDGPEKGLPHHYFTIGEMKKLFFKFNITDIHIDKENHYCLSALKL